MQTFLPYADFDETARVIDSQRLGNQCYREGLTLLRGGWPNHPASKMWRGHERALALYCLALVREMRRRGRWRHEVIVRWARYYHQQRLTLPDTGMPEWLGREDIHSSHRAVLLYKDLSWYGRFGWTEQPLPPDPVTGKFGYVWPVT